MYRSNKAVTGLMLKGAANLEAGLICASQTCPCVIEMERSIARQFWNKLLNLIAASACTACSAFRVTMSFFDPINDKRLQS